MTIFSYILESLEAYIISCGAKEKIYTGNTMTSNTQKPE